MAIRSKFKWWEQCALSLTRYWQCLCSRKKEIQELTVNCGRKAMALLVLCGSARPPASHRELWNGRARGLTRAVLVATKTDKQVFHTFMGTRTQQGEGQTPVGNCAAHGTKADWGLLELGLGLPEISVNTTLSPGVQHRDGSGSFLRHLPPSPVLT